MKISDYPCVVNALHVMEVTIKDFNNNPKTAVLDVSYALAVGVEENGKKKLQSTHGKCTAGNHWSKDVREKLAELLEAMELDLMRQHFKMPKIEMLQTKEDTDESRTEARGSKEPSQI